MTKRSESSILYIVPRTDYERSLTMVTLTFDFNKEKVERDGFTTDELLEPMRRHAKKWGISEPKYGVFAKDGENAMCDITMFPVEMADINHAYVSYLNTWLLNVNGNVEDCVDEIKKSYAEDGIKIIDIMPRSALNL